MYRKCNNYRRMKRKTSSGLILWRDGQRYRRAFCEQPFFLLLLLLPETPEGSHVTWPPALRGLTQRSGPGQAGEEDEG